MNLLLLAGFALSCLGLLWMAQTLALLASGARTVCVLPYRHDSESPRVRRALKLALQTSLLLTLFLYPWAIGENPWQYHGQRFALSECRLIPLGAGLTVGLLTAALVINLTVGWVRFSSKYSPSKLMRKLAKSLLIPLPLTVVEEPLFRGIVQEQLWTALPSHTMWQILAVVISSLVFASLHFVRPQKRRLLPGLGLFALGVLLSVAYLRTGHHYVLPIAIHAGGVWFIQATRPLVEYRGPSWLIGYSSYPICGGVGLIVMTLIGLTVLITVGV